MPPKRRPSGSDRSSDDKNVFIPPERTMNAAQYAATARGSSTPATARADRATRAALLSTSNDKMSQPASNRAPVISPELLNTPVIKEEATEPEPEPVVTASSAPTTQGPLLPASNTNMSSPASNHALAISELLNPIVIKEENMAESGIGADVPSVSSKTDPAAKK